MNVELSCINSSHKRCHRHSLKSFFLIFKTSILLVITLSVNIVQCADCPDSTWFKCTTTQQEELCFKVQQTAGPWNNQMCKNLDQKADLAVLDTERVNKNCVINNWVSLNFNPHYPGIWIGLTKVANSWQWINGKPPGTSSNIYFVALLNSDSCAVLLDNNPDPNNGLWRWETSDCGKNLKALCQMNITEPPTTVGPTTEITTVVTTEITTNLETTTEESTFTVPTMGYISTVAAVYCNPQTLPHNTLRDSELTTAGDYVTYSCPYGYKFIDGATIHSIRCSENTTWNSDAPTCQEITCPGSSSLIGLNKARYGVTHAISCTHGLIFSNGATSLNTTCTISGQWSHMQDNIMCTAIGNCGIIPYVKNADASFHDTLVNSTVSFTCHIGHRFENGHTVKNITCQSDLQWSEEYVLGCLVITCPPVPNVQHGVADTDIAIYGTKATIDCSFGYEYPDKTLTKETVCLESGNWTYYPPNCQAIHCMTPHIVDLGTTSDSGTQADSVLLYTCVNTGDRFWDGTQQKNVTCLHTGQWDNTYLDCRTDRCQEVPTVTNSTVSTLNASVGTEVTYTCVTGHYFTQGGGVTRSSNCTTSKHWLPSITDYCAAIVCGTPPPIDMSTLHYIYNTYGATSNYTCGMGHVWTDIITGEVLVEYTTTALCLANGQWSSATYTIKCLPINCGTPAVISHGSVTYSNTTYRSVATYTCDYLYWFARDRTTEEITCSFTGVWSSVATCREIVCLPLPTWYNGLFNTTSASVGSVVNYTCKSGYQLSTGTQIQVVTICDQKGNWIPSITDCIESDPQPIVIEVTEAPRSVSIGTLAATVIATVFILIAVLDVLSFGKRSSVTTFRFKGMRKRIKIIRKKKRSKRKTHVQKNKSYGTLGNVSPRDVSPLLLQDVTESETLSSINKSNMQVVHRSSPTFSMRKGAHYEMNKADTDIAISSNGLPPQHYGDVTNMLNKKFKNNKLRKRGKNCEFIDLEPLTTSEY